MVERVTYRRRKSYKTRSNKIRQVRTPGNRVIAQYVKKRGKAPKCGDCGKQLPGIPALRPHDFSRISKSKRSVNRTYGGSRCCNCVKERIVRAFLIEERKIVKTILNEGLKKSRAAKSAAS